MLRTEEYNIVGDAIQSLRLHDCWVLVTSRSLQLVHLSFTDEEIPRPTVCDILGFLRRNEMSPLRSLTLDCVMSGVGSAPESAVLLRTLATLDVTDYAFNVAAFLSNIHYSAAETRIRAALESEASMADARALAESLCKLTVMS